MSTSDLSRAARAARLLAGGAVALGAPLAASMADPLYGGLTGMAIGVAALIWLNEERDTPVDAPAELAPAGPTVLFGDPQPLTRDLPAAAERPAMVWIEPGLFEMGSPANEAGRYDDERQHPVELTRGFWMAESAVTQGQYAALMGENPSRYRGEPGDEARPVEQVSWYDAVAYCNRLSAREGLSPAYVIEGESMEWDRSAEGYRLPTEAEWEYAARAGTATATYAGDLTIRSELDAPELDDIAWYGGNSASNHPRGYKPNYIGGIESPFEKVSTQPVKQKRANAWGLYDMLGNVYEWILDWYAEHPEVPVGAPLADPAGPAAGVFRVIRGGSFDVGARGARAAYRWQWRPGDRSYWVGLRPVRAPRAPRP